MQLLSSDAAQLDKAHAEVVRDDGGGMVQVRRDLVVDDGKMKGAGGGKRPYLRSKQSRKLHRGRNSRSAIEKLSTR